jgi:transposase
MYIQRNRSKGKNGKVYTSTLLCTKYREEGKIKTKVEANLSRLPEQIILTIENLLKHGKESLFSSSDIAVDQSIDYGLAFILLHLMDKLRISQALEKILPDYAPLLKAIIIGKILTRGSKLGIYNWLRRNNIICNTLGLNMEDIKVDDLYSVLGRASYAQDKIEHKWNLYNKTKHNEIYLYDITSTYFEGTQNELAAYGYNRDKKKGKMQINIGLITDSDGFPLKIKVFKGNINDHKTVKEQIHDIKKEFGTNQIIFVGDRGMKIRYNLDQMDEAQKQGVDYITGLTHAEIESLLENKILQLKLFSKEIAEVEHDGQRYILSINETLQRQELDYIKTKHSIVEEELTEVKAAWEKRKAKNDTNKIRLKNGHKNKKLVTSFTGKKIDGYKLRVERILIKHKMKKYYSIEKINNDEFVIDFKAKKYQQTKQLAGKYVICTSVTKEKMKKEQVRQEYKNLQNVEHAFRDFKSNNIQIRPVFHRHQAQTRGHVFLSMFSYALIKEMENKLFPFLSTWNKKNKCQLAFADLLEELKDIKLVIFNLGRGVQNVKLTKPNIIQTQILNKFEITKNDLDKLL